MAFFTNDSYNIISRRISNVGISFTHTHRHTDNLMFFLSDTMSSRCLFWHRALQKLVSAPAFAGAAFNLHIKDVIADSGATQTFVMESTPVVNKQITTHPLRVSHADGR
jgi:hypothetical protein